MANFKKRSQTNRLVVHCSATRPSMDVGVRQIRQWHLAQGWLDVGYHYIIRRDGTVETGRPVDTVGSHVRNYNADSVGICLVGGVPENNVNGYEANFTNEQMASLADLLEQLQSTYPGATICGHHDLDSGKACPSFNVSKWLKTGELETSAKG